MAFPVCKGFSSLMALTYESAAFNATSASLLATESFPRTAVVANKDAPAAAAIRQSSQLSFDIFFGSATCCRLP